jgi:hypothetical protein
MTVDPESVSILIVISELGTRLALRIFSNSAISSSSASSGSGSSVHLSFANTTSSRDARKDFFDSSRGPDEILRLRLYYQVKSIIQVKKERKRKRLTLDRMRCNSGKTVEHVSSYSSAKKCSTTGLI